MSKNSKSQSAVEYLTTYGWAIIIIVIVLSVLFLVGAFNPSSSVHSECLFPAQIDCIGTTLGGTGTLDFDIENLFSNPIIITSVYCNSNGNLTNATTFPTAISVSPSSTGKLYAQCYYNGKQFSGPGGKLFEGYLIIDYISPSTGEHHLIKGRVIQTVSAAQAPVIPPVSFNANSVLSNDASNLFLTLPPNYTTYLFACADGAYSLSSESWTTNVYGKTTDCINGEDCASIGYQSAQTGECYASGTHQMTLSGIGLNLSYSKLKVYTAQNASPASSISPTFINFTYSVSVSDSFVVILAASGWDPSTVVLPQGCTIDTKAYISGQSSTYVATCIQPAGSYNVNVTGGGAAGSALAVYVYS